VSRRIQPRQRIYLVCEGQSEQSYGRRLNEIADNAGSHLFLDCDVLAGGDPLFLVELAVRRIREKVLKRGAFVHHAIFLDADKLGIAPERNAQIQPLAQKHRIHLIWQYPCHEGFLLRRFAQQEAMKPQSVELAIQALNKLWPEYRKAMPARELAIRIDRDAVRRAAAVEADLQTFLALIKLADKL
jgi:hypothetical protein